MRRKRFSSDLLLIDIDIPKNFWEKHLEDIFKHKLKFCSFYLQNEIDHYIVKPSRNGNVHVYVYLRKPITNFNEYAKFKYCLGEDHKRLTLDLRRYKVWGKIVQFFWNR